MQPQSDQGWASAREPVRKMTLLLAAGLLAAAGCGGGQMGRAKARDVLTNLPGIKLSRENVYVEGVTQLDARHAVAEASIKAAFKLEKVGDDWIVTEVREERGHWIPIDDLYGRLVESQIKATHQQLLLVALGLERYRLAHGRYPVAADILQLMDQIFPRYISRMVVEDAWSNLLHYSMEGDTRYTVRSAGPDGRLQTDDDILFGSVP